MSITMSFTGLVPGKKGKVVFVSYTRRNGSSTDYAEYQLPSLKLIKSNGFDEGELVQLKIYTKSEEKNIIRQAKEINHDMIYKL